MLVGKLSALAHVLREFCVKHIIVILQGCIGPQKLIVGVLCQDYILVDLHNISVLFERFLFELLFQFLDLEGMQAKLIQCLVQFLRL